MTAYMIYITLMLIIMAVEAEILPVTAISWIIVMVVVFMMHRKLSKILTDEFATTAPTYPRVDTQRLLSITE